jgi:hypothetical protein
MEDPVVVGGAGRLELDPAPETLLVEPVQRLLVGQGGDRLIGKLLSPTRRDEKEDMVGRGAETMGQVMDLPDLSKVGLGDRCVDLKLQARFFQRLDAGERLREGTRNAAEGVVASRIGTVQADAHPPDAGLDQLFRDGFCDECPVRREDHPEPQSVPVSGDLVDVRPKERLAARQDDHRFPDSRDFVEEPQALFGAELPLVRPAQRRGAAVSARQVTAPGHLPGNHPKGIGQDMRYFSLHLAILSSQLQNFFCVIPAFAISQSFQCILDHGFHRGDRISWFCNWLIFLNI